MPCIYFLYSDMQLGNNGELNLYLHTVHLKNKSGTPCLENLSIVKCICKYTILSKKYPYL